jgi:hypothetical protein
MRDTTVVIVVGMWVVATVLAGLGFASITGRD